jgi:hypothetical protein
MFEKKDEFSRVIYKRENDVIRFIYKYYEDTNNIKLKIELIADEQVLQIYDRKRNVIYSSDERNKIILNNIKFYNANIKIKLPIDIKNEYVEILREGVIKFKNRKKDKNEPRTNGW